MHRPLTIILRLLAGLQILTGAIAIIPLRWIADWHVWLGLGPLPDDATLRYVIRGGAFAQAAIGVLLWVVSTDVRRYAPITITVGAIYLVAGPAYYFIDSIAGMPAFWCLFDSLSCFLTGCVIFALARRLPSSAP